MPNRIRQLPRRTHAMKRAMCASAWRAHHTASALQRANETIPRCESFRSDTVARDGNGMSRWGVLALHLYILLFPAETPVFHGSSVYLWRLRRRYEPSVYSRDQGRISAAVPRTNHCNDQEPQLCTSSSVIATDVIFDNRRGLPSVCMGHYVPISFLFSNRLAEENAEASLGAQMASI